MITSNTSRAKRAAKLLRQGYDDSPAKEACINNIADMLTDVRHLCDVRGLDFTAISVTAQIAYVLEKKRKA